tara:strand:- start:272 stop:643 length:372 start_codon:yes stop_codon:yes gene_type:complete
MPHIILVGLGGALGAIARHAIDRVAVTQLGSSVTGTFLVNVSGSFLLGMFTGLMLSHLSWPDGTRMFVAVGFLGSYTTFSTLSVATVHSLEKGDVSGVVVNLGGSVIFGIVAAIAGMVIGKAM